MILRTLDFSNIAQLRLAFRFIMTAKVLKIGDVYFRVLFNINKKIFLRTTSNHRHFGKNVTSVFCK